jgi:hypothetical protein
MSKSYICKRCNYKTCNTADLCNHFREGELCNKILESFSYAEDQLLIMSFLPYKGKNHTVMEEEIDLLPKTSILLKNIKEYTDVVEEAYKSKCKICKFCDTKFDKIDEYRVHIIKECFYDELLKRGETDDDNTESSLYEEVKSYNQKQSQNQNQEQGQTNNNVKQNVKFNININDMNGNKITSSQHEADGDFNLDTGLETIINNLLYKLLLGNLKLDSIPIKSFDENWDVSEMDFKKISHIFMSKIMYSTLLNYILESDKNLNIIFDEDQKTGLVYKNSTENYIKLTANDIVDAIMEKLKNQLLEFLEVIKPKIFDEMYSFLKNMVNKRYQDFLKEDIYKEQIIDSIVSLYKIKKDDAIRYFNRIQK